MIERREGVLNFGRTLAARNAQRLNSRIIGDGANGTVSEWVTQRLHKIVSMGSSHRRFRSPDSRGFRRSCRYN